MAVSLTTLSPAVWGADYSIDLEGRNRDGSIPTYFLADDGISATLSLGQGLPSLLQPAVKWLLASSCTFQLSITAAQMATLAIDGLYLWNVYATRGAAFIPLATGYLPVLPAANAQADSTIPDLCTIPYATRLLARLNPTEAEWEMVPTLIAAASNALRAWCGRRFDRGTVIEQVPVVIGGSLDGYVRLARPPVHAVLRVESGPVPVLSIANPAASSAWVAAITSGDASTAETVTGLTLSWIAQGLISSQALSFTSGQTLQGLASAIAAVGQGWTASTDAWYATWPVTAIIDATVAKGAGPDDLPDGSAIYHAYGSNLTRASFIGDDGANTGIVWVGRQAGGLGPRWGPDWGAFDQPGPTQGATVRVTYDGGFTMVPAIVQEACAMLVRWDLLKLRRDLLLTSERAGEYSYTLDPRWIEHALPRDVLERVGFYRLSQA
jgi:hypothetical protein